MSETHTAADTTSKLTTSGDTPGERNDSRTSRGGNLPIHQSMTDGIKYQRIDGFDIVEKYFNKLKISKKEKLRLITTAFNCLGAHFKEMRRCNKEPLGDGFWHCRVSGDDYVIVYYWEGKGTPSGGYPSVVYVDTSENIHKKYKRIKKAHKKV